MRNFEDVVIFVTDMEQAIAKLDVFDQKLLAMNILEEYTIPEVARVLGCTQRTAERSLQDALDQLSRVLLASGLLEELPLTSNGQMCCQDGKARNVEISDCNEGRNKRDYAVDAGASIAYSSPQPVYCLRDAEV
jgi:hypothetical protein